MGCGNSQQLGKINRTTAVEIIDEKEYNANPENVEIAKFRSNGKCIKVHYRPICPRGDPKTLKLH